MNKTAQILQTIATKKFISLSELERSKPLLESYSSTVQSTTSRRRIIDTCSLLAKQGYVSVGIVDTEKIYKITQKGLDRIKAAQTIQGEIDTSRWGGRWYFVTYDLPESQKAIRNQVILTLKRHNFINYTKGIWILPYNPQKLIENLRKQYNLHSEIKLIVASHIDDEKKLKRQFKLI